MQKMQRRLSLHLASSKIKRSANALLAKKMLMGLPLVTLFGHFETAPLSLFCRKGRDGRVQRPNRADGLPPGEKLTAHLRGRVFK